MRKIYISRKKIPDHLTISEEQGKEIIARKQKQIKEYFRWSGFSRAIIGLSGGIDSTLSLALASQALGPQQVIAVRLPYGGLFSREVQEAEKIALALGLPPKNILLLPITQAVDAAWEQLKKISGEKSELRLGNLMARARMQVLFDLAAARRAIVLGTENKSEHHLGYYTLGGDHLSGLEPIIDLWKTEVYQLAGLIPAIPDSALRKTPSPGLWAGQTDEGEIGLTYDKIDTILSALFDLGLTEAEIKRKFAVSAGEMKTVIKQLRFGLIKNRLPYSLEDSLYLARLLTRSQDYQEIDLRKDKEGKSGEKETEKLVEEVIALLKKRKMLIGVMESCTGGGLSNALTDLPHCSEVFALGLIPYQIRQKEKMGLPAYLLRENSPYAAPIALAMADQARRQVEERPRLDGRGALGVGISGILTCPDPAYPDLPVGLDYVALSAPGKNFVRKCRLVETEARSISKRAVIYQVLQLIKAYLKEN